MTHGESHISRTQIEEQAVTTDQPGVVILARHAAFSQQSWDFFNAS